MPGDAELLTPSETSVISGVPIRHIYKVARERLPRGLTVRRGGGILFRPAAAICFRIDHQLPKDVPLAVRRAFYASIRRDPRARTLEHKAGALSYVLDVSAVERAVDVERDAYREAMSLIVEDPEIQAGAATFKGTRILVHTVADLLKAGVSAEELKEDYPRLTDAMLAAAPIFARSHPRRGRPRMPSWRKKAPLSVELFPRTVD